MLTVGTKIKKIKDEYFYDIDKHDYLYNFKNEPGYISEIDYTDNDEILYRIEFTEISDYLYLPEYELEIDTKIFISV